VLFNLKIFMNKKVYIIRHGETEYNNLRIMQGRSIDLNLNTTGKNQTDKFFMQYKNIDFDLVISSELKRSIESVQKFIDLGIPHLIDERITEISWGANEGKPIDDEVNKRFKKLVEEWSKGNLSHAIPGGETGESLSNRMISFIDDLKQKKENTILISTHGRALKMLITRMLERNISEMENFKHSNTGLYLLEQINDKFYLIKVNDTSHLS